MSARSTNFASVWRGERLSLLHLDVEGAEADVLRGARETLRRDMPIVTAEVHVHLRTPRTQALLHFLAASRYEVFLVEEICGMRADCRNLLCIHRGARSQFRGSDVLDMAVAARAMFPVDAKSILWHAFPCCARGRVLPAGPRAEEALAGVLLSREGARVALPADCRRWHGRALVRRDSLVRPRTLHLQEALRAARSAHPRATAQG